MSADYLPRRPKFRAWGWRKESLNNHSLLYMSIPLKSNTQDFKYTYRFDFVKYFLQGEKRKERGKKKKNTYTIKHKKNRRKVDFLLEEGEKKVPESEKCDQENKHTEIDRRDQKNSSRVRHVPIIPRPRCSNRQTLQNVVTGVVIESKYLKFS